MVSMEIGRSIYPKLKERSENVNKKNLNKSIILIFILVIINFCFISKKVYATDSINNYNSIELRTTIEKIIDWEKSKCKVDSFDNLFQNMFIKGAATSESDWVAFSIGRLGYIDDYESYKSAIRESVVKRYKEEKKLDSNKATEWHRTSLAMLALGGDPTKIIDDTDNSTINLICDGTYDRGKTKPLNAQGINGLTWGLIAVDAMRYSIPEGASDNRNSIIEKIISEQLKDGGFALGDGKADTDITAMTIYALAPYYNSEEEYEYEGKYSGEAVKKTVRQVIDEALSCLSQKQLETGSFNSWGNENLESTAQVLVALCSLGIDPYNDERFIKNDKTVVDGILKFQMEDGGFAHILEGPTGGISKESNSMASEQALYALTSLYRYKEDFRFLYDFRENWDEETKVQIDFVEKSIEGLDDSAATDIDKIKAVFYEYKKVPVEERCYVYNYYKLADLMKKSNIENDSEYLAENMNLNVDGNGYVYDLFNDCPWTSDIRVSDVDKEIDKLNDEILNKFYPIEKVSIKDKREIKSIKSRFNNLSEYDKSKVIRYEDVVRAEALINKKITKIVVVSGILILFIGTFYILDRRKKNKIINKNEEAK